MTLKKDPEKERQEAEESRKENITAMLIVLIICTLIGWWVWSAMQTEPVQPPVQIPIGTSPMIGSGPILVVIFSDFECPFCAQFAAQTFPLMKQRYIDTGEITFVYKHFPISQLHPDAVIASEAAVCADNQDRFWEYHDILYANQDSLDRDALLSYAEELDLDMETFSDCLTTNLRLDDVLRDKDLGIASGVTGTPTFFFNGRKVVGVLSLDQFAKEVEHARGD